MNVGEVRDAVRNGRAIKAPNYHAGKRGLGFLSILAALECCYHVEVDSRTDAAGLQLHPPGWFALANLPNHRRLRIEFDAHEDGQGNLILVVTAYEV